jgi:hypothetical protein
MSRECSSCGSSLKKTTAERHNGDRIELLTCPSEGLYVVLDERDNPVKPTTETPKTTEHVTVKPESAVHNDELVLAANINQGWYTTSESEFHKMIDS